MINNCIVLYSMEENIVKEFEEKFKDKIEEDLYNEIKSFLISKLDNCA